MGSINFISFPKLGISMKINRVAFSLLGRDVYWYGIIIALGFVLGLCYALWRANKEKISSDIIFDIVLWGIPISIVCARVFYVLGDWQAIAGNPWRFFAVWEGGIAIYGAMIGAALVGFTYCKIKKLNVGRIFDLCAPALMIGQIVGRWGNFVNAEVYGIETDLPWGMSINGMASVHPLFLYESVWMFVGLIAILLYGPYKKRNGEIFFYYVLWYGLGRFWMEPIRANEFILRLFGMPISQIVAAATVLVALAMLWYLYAKRPSVKGAFKIANYEAQPEVLDAAKDEPQNSPKAEPVNFLTHKSGFEGCGSENHSEDEANDSMD